MVNILRPKKNNIQANENSAVFKIVKPPKLIAWTRVSQPLFNVEVAFEKLKDSKTKISFQMIFNTVKEYKKIKPFAEPKMKRTSTD